ncbi:hypothetical protein BJ165DRAFT_1535284 [Panaeolus papilionaceus]|nr:hypothetical protein BJ165DRAFT_1535284 [Panaeolus papilionaceus]
MSTSKVEVSPAQKSSKLKPAPPTTPKETHKITASSPPKSQPKSPGKPKDTPPKSPRRLPRRPSLMSDDEIGQKEMRISSLLSVIDESTTASRLSQSSSSGLVTPADDSPMVLSKLRVELRAVKFRLMQTESERDNLKGRLESTEAELMDLYAESSAAVAASPVIAKLESMPGDEIGGGMRLRELEMENEALKKEIGQLKAANKKLKKENEKSQKEDASKASTSIKPVAETLTDKITFDEIMRLMGSFNKAVFDTAQTLAPHIYLDHSGTPTTPETTEKAKRKASRVMGDPLTELLVKQSSQKGKICLPLVEITLRVFMVEFFAPEIANWPSESGKVSEAMSGTYSRMRKTESVLVSRRWRVLTSHYFRDPKYDPTKDFLDRLSSVFLVANWSIPTLQITTIIKPFLHQIQPTTIALNEALFQGMQTHDVFLSLASFNGAYNTEWAKAVYQERESGPTVLKKNVGSKPRVVATVAMGCRKCGPLVLDLPDPPKPGPNQYVLTAEVVLASTMEAITGITLDNPTGRGDKGATAVMAIQKSILSLLGFHLLSVTAGLLDPISNLTSDPVCVQIQKALSASSDVYYFGHPSYFKGVYHWASSSSELSKCVVEPGTAEDVATVLKIVGDTRTPFAVKGGGHATNPGFSSTTGVHISMYRFFEVKYMKSTETVDVGAGLLWDDVYDKLEPDRVTVVGGRMTGVGVAGLILGGGYSWKSDQLGLAVDNVVAFELVTPSGAVTSVTQTTDPELFFALKGGNNNFGIVTKFTLKAFPQTDVWGGTIYYGTPVLGDLAAAIAKFHATVRDPKASMIATIGSALSVPASFIMFFYDAPEPPKGIFDAFLDIPAVLQDVKTRSLASLVRSSPTNITTAQRGSFHTIPVPDITPSLMSAILKETSTLGQKLIAATGSTFSISTQTFESDMLSHTNLPSAFPWIRDQVYIPVTLFASWLSPSSDGFIHSELKACAQRIRDLVVRDGQNIPADAPLYSNYAPQDADLRAIFGPEPNMDRLRAVKRRIDPEDVMGLAGGFKIRP